MSWSGPLASSSSSPYSSSSSSSSFSSSSYSSTSPSTSTVSVFSIALLASLLTTAAVFAYPFLSRPQPPPPAPVTNTNTNTNTRRRNHGPIKDTKRKNRNKATKSVVREDIVDGVAGCIGNTPLIRIKSLSEATGCDILAKAEFLNPGGSVKDRIAQQILAYALRDGLLRLGGAGGGGGRLKGCGFG